MNKLLSVLLGFLAIGIIGGLIWSELPAQTKSSSESELEQNDVNQQDPSLDVQRAREVVSNYQSAFESIMDDTDKQNYLQNFDTKEKIRTHLEEYLSTEYTNELMDRYIANKDNGLYFKAQDSPIFLNPEKKATLTQESEQHYIVSQEQNNELTGHIKKIFHLSWKNNHWIVSKVEADRQDQQTKSAEEVAHDVLTAIHKRDMKALANYADAEQGILFSPYVHVNDDALVFTRDEIAAFSEDNETYVWVAAANQLNGLQLNILINSYKWKAYSNQTTLLLINIVNTVTRQTISKRSTQKQRSSNFILKELKKTQEWTGKRFILPCSKMNQVNGKWLGLFQTAGRFKDLDEPQVFAI
ncbi:hypothetical protein MUN88_21600 [Gracilibacillus caseinilyticus]|uniref:Two-component signal transduction system YycFG, regulatory protein YycI n=1 Tax=Gracilibacillus caseinilyticus TaxID=2932256 RepID=A0ABY4EXL0_9BACI|nr:hypothetical protein [Gracilibacillus caseinilyticus]UOQ48587.1 hypothetical protein MUN88_21600 [Gracilibacillus caseinilyticus]